MTLHFSEEFKDIELLHTDMQAISYFNLNVSHSICIISVDSWFPIVQFSLTDVYNIAMFVCMLLFPLGSFTKHYTLELHYYNLCSYSRFLHKIKQFAGF